MSSWIRRRVLVPVLDLLKQGVTPPKVALCITIGAMVGVFPLIGTTMILCGAAAHILKLNPVAIQAVNYAVYPLQILLLVFFVRLGEWVTMSEPLPISPPEVLAMLKQGIMPTVVHFWQAILHSLLGWVIAAIPVGFGLYWLLMPILVRAAARYHRHKA